jgi:hypothetical protein
MKFLLLLGSMVMLSACVAHVHDPRVRVMHAPVYRHYVPPAPVYRYHAPPRYYRHHAPHPWRRY